MKAPFSDDLKRIIKNRNHSKILSNSIDILGFKKEVVINIGDKKFKLIEIRH